MRTALAVMAKYPRPGAVKTRLAVALGAQAACELYTSFLRDIELRFANRRRELVWCYTPAEADFAALFESAGQYLAQHGDGLGSRMFNVFRELSQQGFDQVLMIGADVPHVTDVSLDEAEARLAAHDVVLGPSRDGGYYLIGMAQPRDLFSGIVMSTSSVLADTLARCESHGLRTALLAESFDVDEIGDLDELAALLRCGAVHLPHTARALNLSAETTKD